MINLLQPLFGWHLANQILDSIHSSSQTRKLNAAGKYKNKIFHFMVIKYGELMRTLDRFTEYTLGAISHSKEWI